MHVWITPVGTGPYLEILFVYTVSCLVADSAKFHLVIEYEEGAYKFLTSDGTGERRSSSCTLVTTVYSTEPNYRRSAHSAISICHGLWTEDRSKAATAMVPVPCPGNGRCLFSFCSTPEKNGPKDDTLRAHVSTGANLPRSTSTGYL